jgi:UDP-2-acetamido-3-amino-2,3-dideoxy-glucuronate N-acetyltransferase
MAVSNLARVEKGAELGVDVVVWDNAHLRNGCSIGRGTTVGEFVYIDSDVQIGNNCKIQNNALVYNPARIGDGVFIGPGVILTNDLFPRATNVDLSIKSATDWKSVGVTIGEGASIGAGAILIAPLFIGSWAMVGAGSVVTKDVKKFALVVGNPARQIGWVGKFGSRLSQLNETEFLCEATRSTYILVDGDLFENS